jgi:hypothetical protein
MTAMGKMLTSLGFWMTIVFFVALGYAFSAVGTSFGADCVGTMDCSAPPSALATSIIEDDNQKVAMAEQTNPTPCPPTAPIRADQPFQQNWQRGGSMYAPGLSIAVATEPHQQVSLCPGPVEVPNSIPND